MKKYLIGLIIILILCVSSAFADSNSFVPATYLDTEAKFEIPDEWIYEGVLFDENYSQKKYTFIKNLDVSILYGMRNLKEEIHKKMPFISADSILDGLSEENIVSILGSASNSTIEEKLYGSNKFYEFTKTQKVDTGKGTVDVNCIVDMMIEGDNIYSFSYIYKKEKDGLVDYGKTLTSFTTKSKKTEPVVEVQSKEEIKEEPKVEPVEEKKEEPIVEIIEIVKEEPKEEQIIENKNEEENKTEIEAKEPEEIVENLEETIQKSGETLETEIIESGNIIEKEIIEETSNEELDFENLGVVQNTYKPKNWVESVFSIIASNPILLIGIIILIIIDFIIVRLIKKKKKNSGK